MNTATVLPASMRARKERLIAQMAPSSGADTPATPPVVGDEEAPVAADVTVDAPSTPVAPSAEQDWRGEFDKAEQRYKSLQGMFTQKSNENDQLRNDFVKMQEEVEKLKGELSRKVVAEKISPADLDNLPGLTDEEQRVYAESAPVIAKLSRKEAVAVVQQIIQPLAQEIAELKRGQKEVGDRSTNTEEALFVRAVQGAIPNMADKVKHPDWGEFLAKKAPFSRATYRDLLQAAHHARDLDAVTEIFGAFAPATLGTSGAFSAPPNTTAGRMPTRAAAKPTLKLSERKKASDDFRMGRITYAKLQEIQKKFAEAEAEGRIDHHS